MTNQTPSNEIDRRLEVLETGIAEVRTRQEANTTSTLTLQNLTSELLDIARLHQQGLRIAQQNADHDREQMSIMQAEIRVMQSEIQQIWQYLVGQQGNGHGGDRP